MSILTFVNTRSADVDFLIVVNALLIVNPTNETSSSFGFLHAHVATTFPELPVNETPERGRRFKRRRTSSDS